MFAAAVGVATAASAVLAVSGARGDAGSGAVQGSGDLTGVVLDCSTDTVTLSGSYRFTENGFVNQLGEDLWFSRGTLVFNLAGLRATGTSGLSYRIVGASTMNFAFFFGAAAPGTDVEHSNVSWHLVPIAGGKPLSFRENFVFVVTPSGSTTVVDHGPSDCG
jgi:hypothetical protein